MNIPLLRKVQNAILLNPMAFDMIDWRTDSDYSPCGSTACICGWAAVLADGKRKPAEISRSRACDGTKDLDIRGTSKLFYASDWPKEFYRAYAEARRVKNHEAAALIAAARIDHFIETEGRE